MCRGIRPGRLCSLPWRTALGCARPWVVAVIYVLVGCSAVAAAAVAVRALAGSEGETLARRMFPAAVLAPAAVWIATSPDAFSGVLAWGVALLAIASTASGWPKWLAATGAGVLLGLCPFLSYGLLTMGLVAVAVLVHTRAWRVFGYTAALVVLQVFLWAAAGFRSTRESWPRDARGS